MISEQHDDDEVIEEELSSDNASVVFVDEFASDDSITTSSSEASPSVTQTDLSSVRRSSLDSTSTNATTRIRLAGPLSPYVSESAVD